MKAIRVLSGFALFSLVIALAGALVYAAVPGKPWQVVFDSVAVSRWIGFETGVVLLLLAIIGAVLMSRKPERDQTPES